MKKWLSYLWQLPQLLLGQLLVAVYFRRIKNVFPCGYGAIVRVEGFNGGISLGPIIIVATGSSEKTIKHEMGHSRQSEILGWLYLVVIGIPSLLWAAFFSKGKDYYSFYTERWADKLGNVKR